MEITLMNRTNEKEAEDFLPLFEKIAASAEKRLKLRKDMEISVTFVRSRFIHMLNKEYRGIDRPTDVISFAANDYTFDNELEEQMADLGDLFININYAKKQAKQYGHSYEREIAFLFTHGLLHCLGYDHMEPEEEKVMFALQDEILDPIMPRQSV